MYGDRAKAGKLEEIEFSQRELLTVQTGGIKWTLNNLTIIKRTLFKDNILDFVRK